MHVAVLIVSYRNPEDVGDCLAALSRSQHTDFEVVVCENGGQAAHALAQQRLPSRLPGGQGVRLIAAPDNPGFAGGVNLALREAPAADAWWVLNPDTIPEPAAMGAKLARLQQGDCEAVGCTLRLTSGLVQSYGGRWQHLIARAVSLGNGNGATPAPDPGAIESRQNYLNGAAMMISRRFLEVAGPMREDYFLYCEEVEWCLRARRLGLQLGFAPDAIVEHKQGTTTGNVSSLKGRPRAPIHLNERNRLLLTRDLYPGLWTLLAPAALASLVMKYARRQAWRQLGFALGGWWSGVRNERGKPRFAQGSAPNQPAAEPI